MGHIRIDGTLIRRLLAGLMDGAAAASVVQFAQAVGIKTVAEFLEGTRTLERPCEMHMSFAQGLLQHRSEPLPSLAQRWLLLAEAAASAARAQIAQ